MMFRAWAGLLLLLFSIGCRSNNEQYDLMQRELRLQEDRIYQLEGYIEQYQVMLDEQHTEPELIGDTKADPITPSDSPAVRRREPAPLSSPRQGATDSLAPPDIDLGEPDSSIPSFRKPVTEDLLPADPVPALPNFDGARSPAWGRQRLSERPLFKSAARPLQRLRERAENLPIWQPNRPQAGSAAPADPRNVAPSWDGGGGDAPAAETRTAEAPQRELAPNRPEPPSADAPPATGNTELKQVRRPKWSPQR